MSLVSGTRFGPYEIAGPIGVGGMGEVYRATDTTLDRDVAIKVLPESFAADAERVARFEREAKTLASLNHANIAQILGLERSEGTTAIVMELIEGPTLAERIGQGPVSPEEALSIAYQIVDALEAAHEQGIVHRDLKPANIKLRPDGTVKVLDFGIAKVIETQTGMSGPPAPSLTTPAMTQSGILLGTAAYMSPEQARGKPVDRRADIWAFGCVLYEMLTGQPAFGGEDVPLTLARVLSHGTDMDSLPGIVSPAVRHSISLCLEKDPKKRIRDIGDVRLALEGRFEAPLPAAPQRAAAPAWRRFVPLAATAIVAVAITAVVIGGLEEGTTAPIVRRSMQIIPEDQPLNLPVVPALAVSPDGSRIVYAAGGALFLRRLSELDGLQVPGTAGEIPIVPVFSPDGGWILFGSSSDGQLKRVSADGGTPLPVLSQWPSGGWQWDEDDMIRYGAAEQILEVPPTGGMPEVLASEAGGGAFEPTRLPGTDYVIYERRPASGESEIAVWSTTTGETTPLFPGRQPQFLEPGYLVYFDSTLGLMARTFEPRTLRYGSPVGLVSDIFAPGAGGGAQFRISANGTLVYLRGEAGATLGAGLGIVDESGAIELLDVPRSEFVYPSVSPDGDQVAVQVGLGNGAQIFVYDLSGESEMRQLTFEGANRNPTWTPDGSWITYSSNRDGKWRIYRQRADGTGIAEALTNPADNREHASPAWTPDGERLAYTETDANGRSDIMIVSLPDGEPEVLVGGDGSQGDIAFSPNGEAIAYTFNAGGTFEVLAEPFPRDGSRIRISEPGVLSLWPVWSRDSTSLSYWVGSSGGNFATVDLNTRGFAIRNRRALPFLAQPDVRRLDSMPEAGRMLVTVPPTQVGGNPFAQREIIVVENWIEELKQRLPIE
jgi:Tol biopolymer transport system component